MQRITINQQVSPSKGNLENLRRWTEDIYGLASDLRGPGYRIWFETEAGEYSFTIMLLSGQEDLVEVDSRQ